MNIVGKRNIFFIISGVVLVPGLIALLIFGLRFGIDFSGGSRLEVESKKDLDKKEIESVLGTLKISEYSIQMSKKGEAVIRTKVIEQKTKNEILDALFKKDKDIKEKSFETIGPTIGAEIRANALKAVLLASVVIAIFIAWAFRQVSRPVASWKFGVSAIIALIHDVLVVVGIFAFLGRFFNVEVDALFITALLTVMGFSVHDTIVVFDRIRENLKRTQNVNFEQLVNDSILQTLNRSLNTSLTVVFVLLALLLFGGASIKWFVVALLIGIVSGTYSSIFTASPLLVVWYNWDRKRIKS